MLTLAFITAAALLGFLVGRMHVRRAVRVAEKRTAIATALYIRDQAERQPPA